MLEAENIDNKVDYAEQKPPEIEIENLVSMLQKDELFQEYLDNNHRKIQSAFQLPEVKLDFTSHNNINSDMDLDSIVSYLEDKVTESLASVAEGVHK